MSDEIGRAYRRARVIAAGILASLGATWRWSRLLERPVHRFVASAMRAGSKLCAPCSPWSPLLGLGLARAARASFAARHAGGPRRTAKRLLTGTIVSLVCRELSAVIGLALSLLQGRAFSFYVFPPLSLIGLVLFFPRWPQWQRWAGRAG